MLDDAVADLSPGSIYLLKLVDIILVCVQRLMIYILDASIIRCERSLCIGELGLVEAEELLAIVNDVV